MRITARALLVVLISTVLLLASVSGQEGVFDHTTGTRGTRMWIPPGVETVRGIFIYGNGAGGDSRNEIYTPWNQVFAYLHGFALIGTSKWGNLSGNEIDIWDGHLGALAASSGHPELVHAPWAPIGFSNGGQMSYGFNALRPEKTFAFITQKGCCYNTRQPSTAAKLTPGFFSPANSTRPCATTVLERCSTTIGGVALSGRGSSSKAKLTPAALTR